MCTTWAMAALMGVVEGITEYLPISSTGHLLLAEKWMDASFHESFEVVIQSGAMLAVLVEYRRCFLRLADFRNHEGFSGFRGLFWLFLTTLPAMAFGLLFHDAIKQKLFTPPAIALALGIGGAAMIVMERLLPSHDEGGVDAVGWKRALGVGFFQCLAMVPGTSRSGATIITALLIGVDRRTAAEFSFILAIPTMLAATAFSLFKAWDEITPEGFDLIAVGFLTAFVVALVTVRTVLAVISRTGFAPFGWYRIALGGLMLAVLWARA